MIAACYSNPSWDGKDNADKRKQYLDDLNAHFNKAITAIYYPGGPHEVDVDWDNPFFAAHKREIERTKIMFAEAMGEKDMAAVEKLAEEEASVDQAEPSTNGNVRGEDLDQYIPRNT
jgi:hypothetical protein